MRTSIPSNFTVPAWTAAWGRRIKDLGRVVGRSLAMATADARVLPEIIIIGVKRGGTTSLFRDLEHHRSMCPLVPSARRLPLSENMKGVHYFDTGFDRSARWYRSHFASRLERWRVTRSTGAAFSAEASPYYLFQPQAASRAAALLPSETKFVIALRDPVERTVSHWSEQTRNGIETLPLRAALDAEAGRLGDDHAQLEAGAINTSHAHEQQSYTAQSMYAASIQRWIEAVGVDRLVIVFSEDYSRDPVAAIRQLTDAIGVAPIPPSPGPTAGEHRNAAPRASSIDAELDSELTDVFRDDVDQLTKLIGCFPPWPRFQTPDPSA
jgi:hypothetical protein